MQFNLPATIASNAPRTASMETRMMSSPGFLPAVRGDDVQEESRVGVQPDHFRELALELEYLVGELDAGVVSDSRERRDE